MSLPPLALPSASNVLLVGCHADDIEIGCGGTILSLLAARPGVHVTWVVLAADGARAEEARRSADAFLAGAASVEVIVKSFRDGFLPYTGEAVKETFEELKRVEPDVVFTHAEHDRHQDHRLACELTWNTFRRHLILEYEVPKYDGDVGNPSVFVPLADEIAERKVALLAEHFASQGDKHWFDRDLFLGLLRLRGMQANVPTRYAESFYCRKLSLTLGAP